VATVNTFFPMVVAADVDEEYFHSLLFYHKKTELVDNTP